MLRHAIDSNLAFVSPHISGANAEAEARAFAAFGGEKRFKDVRQNVTRDAAAGVADADFDAVREGEPVGGNR